MTTYTITYMGGRNGDIEMGFTAAQTMNAAISIAEGLPPGSNPRVSVDHGEKLTLQQFRVRYGSPTGPSDA
jgi:hypothetical protein